MPKAKKTHGRVNARVCVRACVLRAQGMGDLRQEMRWTVDWQPTRRSNDRPLQHEEGQWWTLERPPLQQTFRRNARRPLRCQA